MSLFSNIKNVLKVNNGLPIPIKSGTRIVDGDTGDDYVFDGKHWNRIVMSTSTRPAYVAAPPGSSMFPPSSSHNSSNTTSSPRRTISSSNNVSDSSPNWAADLLASSDSGRSSSSGYSSSTSSWSSDSSCSSDSSSSCDSGGGSCD